MSGTNPNSPTTTVANRGNGNINNVEESTMSDKTGSKVIILRTANYNPKATTIIPEAGIEQSFPDDNAAIVFATRVTIEVLRGHATKKVEDLPYAFMVVDNGIVTFDATTVDDEQLSTATVVLSSGTTAKPKVAIKKRPVAATKPPVKKAAAKKTVAAPTKAPAVRKRPTPPAAPAAPARKTAPAKKAAAPAKKAAPAAPRKTVAAAPAKAPARKTAPPAKKAPARKTAPSKK